MNQSIGKIASLFVAVVFISGCAGTASPVEEAQKALSLGNNAAAEQLFKQALATGTINTAEAAYQLGNLDLQGMNYEGAERYYQQAVDLKPDNLLYLDAAGFVARERGNTQRRRRSVNAHWCYGKKLLVLIIWTWQKASTISPWCITPRVSRKRLSRSISGSWRY